MENSLKTWTPPHLFPLTSCIQSFLVLTAVSVEKKNIFPPMLNNLNLCVQWWATTDIIRKRAGQLHHLSLTLLSWATAIYFNR